MTDKLSCDRINEPPTDGDRPRFRRALLALFLVAACVRGIDVWRPIDGTVRHSWRETDTGAIARNFYREDMNILRPRIDWRGDGPGYVESEFPLFPWTAACLYHVFGYHEEILRVISYLLSLGSCLIFLRLARRLLPHAAILPAWAVFALSPMAVRMASAVQPEPLMFFCYLLSIDAFLRWVDHGRRRDFVIALLATMLAILAKVPAAHIGILFACLCLRKFGLSVVRRREIWAFAVVALGVSIAWYGYAHSLWLEYGNSLGISNEAYKRISTGNFLVTLWETVPGVVSIESLQVWMGVGFFFGIVGLLAARKSEQSLPLVFWTLALTAYFVVTGRTTGESWAAYYHIVSTPLAALLIGIGFHTASRTHVRISGKLLAVVSVAAAISFVAAEVNAGTITPLGRVALVVGVTAAAAGLSVQFENATCSGKVSGQFAVLLPSRRLMLSGFAAVLLAEAAVIHHEANPNGYAETYQMAVAFSQHTTADDLIVVGGASEVDQHGLLRASDCPYIFFWMDRKGFILHDDKQSVAQLTDFRQRGARYFIAERSHLQYVPGFEDELRTQFNVVDERSGTLLIDLGSTAAGRVETTQAAVQSVSSPQTGSPEPTRPAAET